MPDRQLLRHPGLLPLWAGLNRERRQQQIAALLLLLLGLGASAWSEQLQQPWIFGLGGLAIIGALFWLYKLLSRQPASELYQLLLEEADTFGWVYAEVTERMPFGLRFSTMATVYLFQANDKVETAVGIPADKAKLVLKTLERLLPNAVFGYSPDLELQYRGAITPRRGWWKPEES